MGFELYPATLERNHHPQVNLVNQTTVRITIGQLRVTSTGESCNSICFQGDILLRGEGGQEVCGAKGIS